MSVKIAVLLFAFAAISFSNSLSAGEKGTTTVPAVLQFKVKDIDGKEVDLSKYKGKVVLFVNVASACGYTPHYKGLQALHERFAKDGLAILGFPSNDFGGQEPGTEAQIKEFCTKEYHVSFDMFSKIDVVGPKQAPLYKYLTSKATNPKNSGKVQWNFELFLVGRDGNIAARFLSEVDPESEQVVQAIQTELKKKE